jgi:hypothetical protein
MTEKPSNTLLSGTYRVFVVPSRTQVADPGSIATRRGGHAPRSVRLAAADVGYLWGIRTEVVGWEGISAGHSFVACGL